MLKWKPEGTEQMDSIHMMMGKVDWWLFEPVYDRLIQSCVRWNIHWLHNSDLMRLWSSKIAENRDKNGLAEIYGS
jgi:hypothetical protein